MGDEQNSSSRGGDDSTKKSLPKSSPNGVPDTTDDSPEKEDYEYFIKELQKIIDESPNGMQAQFARAIAQLKQSAHQNVFLKNIMAESKEKKLSREEIKRRIMKLIQEEPVDESPEPTSKKFRKMLQVARLREELSADAKKNN